jgi:hypothetical protein
MAQSILEMAKDLVMAQIQAGHYRLTTCINYREPMSLMELKAKRVRSLSTTLATAQLEDMSANGVLCLISPNGEEALKYTIECLNAGQRLSNFRFGI